MFQQKIYRSTDPDFNPNHFNYNKKKKLILSDLLNDNDFCLYQVRLSQIQYRVKVLEKLYEGPIEEIEEFLKKCNFKYRVEFSYKKETFVLRYAK